MPCVQTSEMAVNSMKELFLSPDEPHLPTTFNSSSDRLGSQNQCPKDTMDKEVDIHDDMDVCCLVTGFVQKLSQK